MHTIMWGWFGRNFHEKLFVIFVLKDTLYNRVGLDKQHQIFS